MNITVQPSGFTWFVNCFLFIFCSPFSLEVIDSLGDRESSSDAMRSAGSAAAEAGELRETQSVKVLPHKSVAHWNLNLTSRIRQMLGMPPGGGSRLHSRSCREDFSAQWFVSLCCYWTLPHLHKNWNLMEDFRDSDSKAVRETSTSNPNLCIIWIYKSSSVSDP